MTKLRVAIIGSGNWGSAIAKIIGNNVKKTDEFENEVRMYVYEEMVDGRKLTEIINTEHENVKYLKGFKLPENIIADSDLLNTAKDADILVFVLPHQFIRRICGELKGNIKKNAYGLSLIKGNELVKRKQKEAIDCEAGTLKLISEVIKEILEIQCNVLMGANLAGGVAAENYCESTIGCTDIKQGDQLKRLLSTNYFRLTVATDLKTVELCGALKNVVAVAAGVTDGLGHGDNTKAAVIRLGLMEMIAFVETYFPGCKRDTFFESCGIADLVTTCYGGRNRRVAEAMARTGKSIEVLEIEMLNGQSLQGPQTAEEINKLLKVNNNEDKFPMFTAVHNMCTGQIPCESFIECLQNHPEHMNDEAKSYVYNGCNEPKPKSWNVDESGRYEV